MDENARMRAKRRRVRQLRRRIKRAVYCVCAGLVVIIAMTFLFGGKREEKKAQAKAEAKISEEQAKAEKKQKKIKEVLKEDAYGKQLKAVYKKYPETEKLLLNRDEYPDWLVEYYVNHPEAVEWVLAYPEYMAKPAEEIENFALKPVDLKNHLVQENIPVYFQWDLDWGYASYGNGMVAVEGCGPTCLAMVATGLTGDTSLTPKKIAELSESSGYYAEGFGTDWMLMSEGAAQLGITSNQIQSWSVDTLLAELNAGHPIISSMGPGDFTTQGHFVVLVGVSDDGKIILNDPNSRINTRKKWDPQRLLNQMEGGWAFSI